jgi:hypothetical protein
MGQVHPAAESHPHTLALKLRSFLAFRIPTHNATHTVAPGARVPVTIRRGEPLASRNTGLLQALIFVGEHDEVRRT